MASPHTRLRFSPSPTGYLHIGGLRTALYNELFAKRTGGDFILRIEDTDRVRFVEGGIENICGSLKALNLIPNEGVWIDDDGKLIELGSFGPYLQSARKDRHLAYAMQLVEKGDAYHCFCSTDRLTQLREEQQAAHLPTMYDGKCRSLSQEEVEKRVAANESHVIRLKLPKEGTATFDDVIRGSISFEWALIDDQVIIKSDGYPTYHLAATCDDHDMEITHVVRGEDWVSSTPKHLFIYNSFGWNVPAFAHLPLLLNADRSKLSKRQGDVAVEDYLAKGYLPDALLNFVALLGWNPSAEQEIYTHQQLREAFELSKVNKAGAVFNIEKLDWLNEQYIRAMTVEDYLKLTRPFITQPNQDAAFIDRCLLIIRDRVRFAKDVETLTSFFFAPSFDFSAAQLTWKTQAKPEAIERLQAVSELLTRLSDADFVVSQLELKVKALIAERGWGNGDTLWPLRVSLSGQEKSPGPFELLEAYGKTRSLERLGQAIAVLKQ
ncbi:glutamate--tRNA ligase [Patescibacteria group bacterium]|nr:glutamate--tRNA ligase [Patescibacteria group bacterium]